MASVTGPDGVSIAFDEQGDGRALLLVHGITESRRAWDPVMPFLVENWRVVRVDVRGHGESERRGPYDPMTLSADVAAVVAAADLEDPLLVGHSMGGVVVTAYGATGHPARGIVNVDQLLRLGDFKTALEPVVPMLRGDDESFRQAMATVFAVLDGPLPPGERQRLDALSSPESEVVLGIWEPVLEESVEALEQTATAMLAAIRVPYLALHGSDPGLDYVAWLTARVAGARLEVWPDTGHYPQLVDPERFATRLDQFDGGL
jgi:pimeloyl-ACP methyl ester carboxylesterase